MAMLGLGSVGNLNDQPGGHSHEQLVEMVKNLQRQDPVARSQWGAYVNQHGSMVRDPFKHPAEFLHTFLTQYNSGVMIHEPEEVFSGNASISDLVKLGQKRSSTWKSVWTQYCSQYGGGTNDPSKHPAEFLYNFLDYIADMASQAINSGNGSGSNTGVQLPVGSGGGGKRMRDGPLGGMSADPERDALVSQVKQIQRQGDAAKEAWSIYCDMHLGGVKDPGRHDAATLTQFLQSQGITPGLMRFDAVGSIGAPPPKRQRIEPVSSGYGGGHHITQADPLKDKLVGQIKAFQRLGEYQKELWASFCDQNLGGMRDPNRHTADVLHQFVTTNGVPENLGGQAPSMPGTDPVKDQLVSQVKNFQRQGEEQKVMWAIFCDTHFAGMKDPSRHDTATLQEFVNGHMPTLSSTSAGGYGGMSANSGTTPGDSWGGCGGYMEDGTKATLVQRVKNFMRLSSEHFNIWHTFCAGGKRDPSLMDEVKLQEFCDNYGVS